MNATEDRTDTTPRVWVGCLACYNAGHLVGEWFDATDAPQDMGEWNAEIAKTGDSLFPPLHRIEDHEELWCFDHENFHGLLTGECSPAEATRLAEEMASVQDPAAYGAYAWMVGRDYATPEGFEEAYQGEYDSEEAFAQELAEELDAIPSDYSWPASYIDWTRATRDLFITDYSSARAPDGGVYVFRSV